VDFVSAAKNVHGELYDYSRAIYTNSRTALQIICSKHGSFYQTPAVHLSGHHCALCKSKGFSAGQLQWLDFIRQTELLEIQDVTHGGEFKVGKYRVDGYNRDSNTVFEYNGCFYHGCPQCFEPVAINKVNFKRYGDLYAATEERERQIVAQGFKFIKIWEHQWQNAIKIVRKIQRSFRARRRRCQSAPASIDFTNAVKGGDGLEGRLCISA